MEKQVAYTITTEPTATRTRKIAKLRPIPDGYFYFTYLADGNVVGRDGYVISKYQSI